MSCMLCALLTVALSSIILKIYIKLNTRWNRSYTCLIGKTAIVTGANSGIGYFTALDFAKRGARVILACRDIERADAATKRIIRETKNTNVVYRLVDFNSLTSVRAFADDINKTENRIDILVNNAGIGSGNKKFTQDGLQIVTQVNHIAGFLLTHLLIGKIKASSPGRIVNVSSFVAQFSKLNVSNLNVLNETAQKKTFPSQEYRNSKLCNILFTLELAKRLRGSGVTVNALHPGAVYTPIFRKAVGITRFMIDTLGKLYFWTPEEGAQTQIYLSVSGDVSEETGQLFSNCKKIAIYKSAADTELARKVWIKSEELAKLLEEERIL